MTRETTDQRLIRIHAEAIAEFDKIQSAVRDERLQCLQDRRFYSIAGAQWEGQLAAQFENKPRFEVNKIHLAVIRIINEYRNNRIQVNFVSKGGENKESLAEACADLYRADEQDSAAEEAFDNGFEEAVGGGMGAWRLRACYEDEYDDDDERQRIRIEPIFDADSCVFFDLNAKRQDKADAKRCWVLTGMSREAYKEEYGDDPATWPKQVDLRVFDWVTPNVIYIAEFYQVEEVKETVRIFRDQLGEEEKYRASDFDDDPELEEFLSATGWKEVRQKRIKTRKIHKYIMNGQRVLEDCGYIAGKNIPIVPVYGKRWFVDGVERCMGHVRLAKDPQRLKNMQLSKLGEISAYSSIEKPIFTPEQVGGHQVMWSEDNVKNYPYLLINQLTDQNGNPAAIGPQAYTRSPNIPPAMAALLQITETDMQDVLGNQQAGEQIQANISGKAIELIQNRLDMQSFIYVSNMAKAVKRTGEIWLSMAKETYVDEGRKMKGVGEQGQITAIDLMQPVVDDDGEIEYENDLQDADFDVAVDVGPTSASKRQSTVRALTGMLQITDDPETKQVLSAMAMMNMEGEGIADVRDFFRQKLVRLGVVKPTDEEIQQMQMEAQGKQPSVQDQAMAAMARQAEAEAVNARADSILKINRARESEAKTIEILSGIERDDREQLLAVAETLGNPE